MGVSGTHGVGKTSLIKAVVSQRPSVAIVGNVMRGLASEGYGVGPNVEPRTVEAYFRRQFESEEAQAEAVVRLSDRTGIDGLAYLLASAELKLGYEWGRAEIESAREHAIEHARRFDLRVLVPIEFPLAGDHFLVGHGEELRRLVDDHLRDELGAAGLVYVTVTGSVYDRRDQVLALLDERWGAGVGSGTPH